jgi:hypothetical protein
VGAIDLTDARTSYLADDPSRDWPHRAHIVGFTYERFASLDFASGKGVWSARERIAWLGAVAPEDPGPWEQVATVLRANGDGHGADDVLAAYRRLARRRLQWSAWPRRLADGLWDVAVRYGYRPQRALGVLVALVITSWAALVPATVHDHLRASDTIGVVYSPAGALSDGVPTAAAAACGGGRVRCFNPLFYAVDTVVPIIDLHQRSDRYPAPDDGGRLLDLVLDIATVLGWLFSTVFAVALARLGGSE